MDVQLLYHAIPDVLTPMEAAKVLHIGRIHICQPPIMRRIPGQNGFYSPTSNGGAGPRAEVLWSVHPGRPR